jgi:hypothetical protein
MRGLEIGTLKRGLVAGLNTTWTLGKIIFPITIIVTILSHTAVLDWVIGAVEPLMKLIGLPGEAAIPLVLANFLNLYAGIGAILTLELTVKHVFILAVMMSFSHNLFIESTVAAKVGIKMWVVVAVRLGLALVSAILISLLWHGGGEQAQYGLVSPAEENVSGWWNILWAGFEQAFFGVFQLAMIVIPLMFFIQVLKDTEWLNVFSRWMTPVTKMLGMKPNTSTTLASGLIFGLAFGAGVMIQAVREDGVDKKDLYLAFIFLVGCHAVIEDTVMFIPLGIPVLPLLLTRLITATILTICVALLWDKLSPPQRRKEEVSYEN